MSGWGRGVYEESGLERTISSFSMAGNWLIISKIEKKRNNSMSVLFRNTEGSTKEKCPRNLRAVYGEVYV